MLGEPYVRPRATYSKGIRRCTRKCCVDVLPHSARAFYSISRIRSSDRPSRIDRLLPRIWSHIYAVISPASRIASSLSPTLAASAGSHHPWPNSCNLRGGAHFGPLFALQRRKLNACFRTPSPVFNPPYLHTTSTTKAGWTREAQSPSQHHFGSNYWAAQTIVFSLGRWHE